jgi:FkbM family methyltransferase
MSAIQELRALKRAVGTAVRRRPGAVRVVARFPLSLPPGRLRNVLVRRVTVPAASQPMQAVVPLAFGASMAVDTRDLVQKVIYVRGVWEPTVTATAARLLRRGDRFVDVGAYVGYYALLAHHLVGPAGRVCAIEPNPDSFARLLDNLGRNGAGAVEAHQTAVGKEPGVATLHVGPESNRGNSTLALRAKALTPTGDRRSNWGEGEAVAVSVHPLAEYMPGDDRPLVIKIDAEGFERQVLAGADGALSEGYPEVAILVEVTPAWSETSGEDVDWFNGFVGRHGFGLFRLANDYDAPEVFTGQAEAPAPTPAVGPDRMDYLLVRGPVLLARLGAPAPPAWARPIPGT